MQVVEQRPVHEALQPVLEDCKLVLSYIVILASIVVISVSFIILLPDVLGVSSEFIAFIGVAIFSKCSLAIVLLAAGVFV